MFPQLRLHPARSLQGIAAPALGILFTISRSAHDVDERAKAAPDRLQGGNIAAPARELS